MLIRLEFRGHQAAPAKPAGTPDFHSRRPYTGSLSRDVRFNLGASRR